MNRRQFAGLVLMSAPDLFVRRSRIGAEQWVERWSWAMGQPVHIVLLAGSEQEGLDACAAALEELRAVDQSLTLFDDASDLCELNRQAGLRPIRVGHHLGEVLRLAREARRLTAGAFNPAIEPLMRVWGFRSARRDAPAAAEIAEAREAVQSAVVRLDGDRVHLPNGHTKLDLGGIGVGYGIDRMMDVLRMRRIRRAFIDISGDCAALDAPPGDAGWPVGIADPDGAAAVLDTWSLANAALATSSNDVSAVSYGPVRAGHVLDPFSGVATRALRQVTVGAGMAALADALSTGMLVSGMRPTRVARVLTVPAVPDPVR